MVRRLLVDSKRCVGCHTCELACSFAHHGTFNPRLSRVSVFDDAQTVATVPVMCTQCDEAYCMTVCPTGANARNSDGVIVHDSDKCILCKMCVSACPDGNIAYSKKIAEVFKCDMCGGSPSCALYCPTGAITVEDTDKIPIGQHRPAVQRLLESIGETDTFDDFDACDIGATTDGISASKAHFGDKILRVDLSSGTVQTECLDPGLVRDFIGGRGLAEACYSARCDSGVEPLSPENELVFMTGPLTGTGAASAGRYEIVSKSPYYGSVAAENCGGHFGASLRFAGFDGLIISGKSEHPVYLSIEDGQVDIRDARELWGCDVPTTAGVLIGNRDGARAVCIGPAGERCVPFASVADERNRLSGPAGFGAVMGSKNLKGIVVSGTGSVGVADPEAFRYEMTKARAKLLGNPITGTGLAAFGTALFIDEVYPDADVLFGRTLMERFYLRSRGCFGCGIACGRVMRVPDDSSYACIEEGPECEAASCLGIACDVDDLSAVCKANDICNRSGLDASALGLSVATAMELLKEGVISEQDIGFPLGTDNGGALVHLAQMVAAGEGFGAMLELGPSKLAAHYGHPECAQAWSTEAQLRSEESRPLEVLCESVGICVLALFGIGLPEIARQYRAAAGSDETEESLYTKAAGIYAREKQLGIIAGGEHAHAREMRRS